MAILFVCFPLVFLLFPKQEESMCFVPHMSGGSFRIPVVVNEVLQHVTFLSSTRLVLSVAGVSLGHAAFHYRFIGFDIQLTFETLVQILTFYKQMGVLCLTLRDVSFGRAFFFLIQEC